MDGASRFTKEAAVQKTLCIVSLGQQGAPQTVAETLKAAGFQSVQSKPESPEYEY